MTFNIEIYLDSLPEDIKKINVIGKGIDHLPNLSRFKKLKYLNCSNNKLTYLPPLNKNLKELFCSNNQLTSLPPLNKKLKYLYCCNNHLTSLPYLNEKLNGIYCSNNQLTSLHSLNKKLKYLCCSNNKLTYLPPLNKNLKELFCSNNKLTSLPNFNEKLKNLYCCNNQLTSLPYLNEKIELCDYSVNPIYEIISTRDKHITNQKVKILNNFRYSYYCLKFKKQFRDLLWVKIREPIIRKKYHPKYLIENLPDEETDLDEVLNNW